MSHIIHCTLFALARQNVKCEKMQCEDRRDAKEECSVGVCECLGARCHAI